MTASLPRMIIHLRLRSPAVVQRVIFLSVAVVQVQRQQLVLRLGLSWACPGNMAVCLLFSGGLFVGPRATMSVAASAQTSEEFGDLVALVPSYAS